MKGKDIWRKWLCMVLVAGMLVNLSGTAFSAQNGMEVEWTYDNSILVHVEADESRTFLPEDFPGIDCKKVFVLEKKQKDKGFEYKLVLLLRDSGDSILERAMNEVRKQPMVVDAERNEEYVQRESVLHLNHSCIYLAVGESANIFIKDLDLHMPVEYQIYGVKYTLNLPVYNPDSLDKDSFSAYGISRFWPETQDEFYILVLRPEELEAQKSENGVYYGISKEGTEDVFDAAGRLGGAPEILNVSIESGEGGFIIAAETEYWNIKSTDIAECTLSGGTMGDIEEEGDIHVITPLNQNAAVRGLKPGVTTLVCERSGREGVASSNCTVIVYEPGSKNNPGDMDHDGAVSTDDALQVLKHSVGLISLDEAGKQTADLDQNGIVNTDDALLMLKISAGLL